MHSNIIYCSLSVGFLCLWDLERHVKEQLTMKVIKREIMSYEEVFNVFLRLLIHVSHSLPVMTFEPRMDFENNPVLWPWSLNWTSSVKPPSLMEVETPPLQWDKVVPICHRRDSKEIYGTMCCNRSDYSTFFKPYYCMHNCFSE